MSHWRLLYNAHQHKSGEYMWMQRQYHIRRWKETENRYFEIFFQLQDMKSRISCTWYCKFAHLHTHKLDLHRNCSNNGPKLSFCYDILIPCLSRLQQLASSLYLTPFEHLGLSHLLQSWQLDRWIQFSPVSCTFTYIYW
jgi:hypothetical protein